MEKLTLQQISELPEQELIRHYRETAATCRYHHNTDCIVSWRKEKESRNAADVQWKMLSEEFLRRKIKPPVIP